MIDQAAKNRAILVFILGLFLLSSIIGLLSLGLNNPPPRTITINGSRLNITIADSEEEREKGLSGTPQLKDGTAMLFVFDESSYHSIWMKDMNYPIDIIWLDEDKQVVHIQEFATPDSYPRRFTPQVPARYVIELPVGSVKSYGLNNGRTVSFSL